MSKPGSMRSAMPATAAWIDQLRDAFGAQAIDTAIRQGMDGLPTFHAAEAGHEIGTRFVPKFEAVVHPVPPSTWRPRAAY